MDPLQGIGHHELGAQQPDPVDGHRRHLFGVLRKGQIRVDPGCQGAQSAGPGLLGRSRDSGRTCRGPLGHRAPGAIDGDDLAVAQHDRGVAGAHDCRDT